MPTVSHQPSTRVVTKQPNKAGVTANVEIDAESEEDYAPPPAPRTKASPLQGLSNVVMNKPVPPPKNLLPPAHTPVVPPKLVMNSPPPPLTNVMVSQPDRPKLTRRATLRCAGCEGFNTYPIRRFEKVRKLCATQGIEATDRICPYFSPNVTKLAAPYTSDHDKLFELGDLLAGFPPDKLNIMIGLLWAEKTTRKLGWRFFEKVYYLFRGYGDYYDDYVTAYVLDATPERVRLTNEAGDVVISVFTSDDATQSDHYPSLFRQAEFDVLRLSMKGMISPRSSQAKAISALRLLPLNELISAKGVHTLDDLVDLPPPADDEISDGAGDFEVSRVRKKGRRVRDLVDITSDITRSFSRVSTAYYDDEAATDVTSLAPTYSESDNLDPYDPYAGDDVSDETADGMVNPIEPIEESD
jgi:hypothetical protein